MRSLILAAAVLALPAVARAAEEATRAELKKLEGTWQLVSAETDGKKTAQKTIDKIRVVIQGSKHTVYYGNKVVVKPIPFTIDPSRTPKEVTDTLPDGKEIKGIYEVDADMLKSCTAPAGKERPKEFSAGKGTGYTLRVFKRVKE